MTKCIFPVKYSCWSRFLAVSIAGLDFLLSALLVSISCCQHLWSSMALIVDFFVILMKLWMRWHWALQLIAGMVIHVGSELQISA
jgi:hypothetical protein